MEMVDRVALIVTPKRRFIDWVNRLPDAGRPLTIDEAKSLRLGSALRRLRPEGQFLAIGQRRADEHPAR